MPRTVAALLVTLALALVACAPAEQPATTAAPPETTTTETEIEPPTTEPPPTVKPACLPVSAATRKAIGNADRGTSITLTRAQAVASQTRPRTFYIAAWFTSPGLGEQYGVWAVVGTSKPDQNGQVVALDPVAIEYTRWPDASTTSTGITADDIEASDAALCILGPS